MSELPDLSHGSEHEKGKTGTEKRRLLMNRIYYKLTKVNNYGEEIDYINREFNSEDAAWEWLREVEHIKSRKHWEVRKCEVVRVL